MLAFDQSCANAVTSCAAFVYSLWLHLLVCMYVSNLICAVCSWGMFEFDKTCSWIVPVATCLSTEDFGQVTAIMHRNT